MKKIKSLLILSAVLVLLLMVYLVVSPMWSEDNNGDTTTAQPEHTVAVVDHNTLVGFELTKADDGSSETLVFSIKEDLTGWVWSENAEVPLDNEVFASVVTALTDATSAYKLENVASDDLATYGLDAPAYTLKLTFEDGSEQTYYVGNLNSFNSLYYFSEAGSPKTVYMVDSSVPDALELDIYDFVLEETPPVITEAKILSLEYLVNDGTLKEFVYYPSGNDKDYTDKYDWYYALSDIAMSSVPSAMPLNGDIADSLTYLITSLSFDECVGFDCNDEAYGFFDSQKITVKYNVENEDNGVLTDNEYVIYIGSQTEDGDIYAHTADSKLVYLISDADEWLGIINGEHKDFAASELWLANYELIDSLTFKTGENELAVDVINTDGEITYSSEGKDSKKLEELLEALEAVNAVSHVSVLDKDTALEKKVFFTLEIKFANADKVNEIMTVESYTENYCRVTFMDDSGRLITTEEAEKLASLIADITVEKD